MENERESKNTDLWRLGPASRLPGQSQQDPVQELIGLLIILGDVGVAMESKHTGIGEDRKTPDVVNIQL